MLLGYGAEMFPTLTVTLSLLYIEMMNIEMDFFYFVTMKRITYFSSVAWNEHL